MEPNFVRKHLYSTLNSLDGQSNCPLVAGPSIPVTFAAGDQFGALAKSTGVVEVYKNGTLVGSVSGVTPFQNVGGKIGLKMVNASATLLDDFGGGDEGVCVGGQAAGGVAGNSLLAPNCQPLPTATPTPTATPDITCVTGEQIIDLIPGNLYPTRTVNELIDMGITNTTGIYVVSGPTINATRIQLIDWGQQVRVYARITFPQTGFSSQVWYQVSLSSGTSAIGWIVVRYENQVYIQADDPCASVFPTPPSNVSFTYNRTAAANYAVQQATQNNLTAPPVQKVIRRLSGLPFAYFLYDALSSGTGSAVFVSEAIWMGGLPMTIGDPNSCTLQPGPVNLGWRYCYQTGLPGLSSPPWDFHEALGEYYTDAALPQPNISNVNNVLTSSSKGTFVRNVTVAEMNNFVTLSSGTFQTPGDVFELSQFSRNNLNAVQKGDYAWIDSVDLSAPVGQQGDYHGLLVAGWADSQTCNDALNDATGTNGGSPVTLYLSYNDAFNSPSVPKQTVGGDTVALVIPYVVDFNGYAPNYLQSPTPRPFFCTRWQQFLNDPTRNFKPHVWWFYRLAANATNTTNTITVNSIDLYADPLWNWLATDN